MSSEKLTSKSESNKKKFLEIVADILEIDTQSLNLRTKKDQLAGWDSLAQIKIIAEIEEQFKTTIPIEEIPKIITLKDFLAYINKR